MIVYIAGPYSAPTAMLIQENIEKARSWAVKLANESIGFICPHLNTAQFGLYSEASESFYKEMDLDILSRCDAILMIPGWKRSPGACEERLAALLQGIPVFYAEDDWDNMVAWYRTQTQPQAAP